WRKPASGSSAARGAARCWRRTRPCARRRATSWRSRMRTTWAPDALRNLVRAFADPEVAYVCGRLVLQDAEGTNREGVYWRFETWLREQESALGSITGGNGAVYAVRREDYPEVDDRFGHDRAL